MFILKRKRLFIPLLLLVIILLSSMFRWDIEATKTSDNLVLKWERDRWTGDLWVKFYSVKSSGMILALPEQLWAVEKHEHALTKRRNLTKARNITAGVMVFWFVMELLLYSRRKKSIKTDFIE